MVRVEDSRAESGEDSDVTTQFELPPPGSHARPTRARKATTPPTKARRSRPSLPRLQSSPDKEGTGQTAVNDLVMELALLAQGARVPRLRRPLTRHDSASPPEALLASLVDAHMSIRAIVDTSPLPEDETLRYLAHLVETGVVTLR